MSRDSIIGPLTPLLDRLSWNGSGNKGLDLDLLKGVQHSKAGPEQSKLCSHTRWMSMVETGDWKINKISID